jgi:uncharacterized membrane protein YjjP (DUF1212 family)
MNKGIDSAPDPIEEARMFVMNILDQCNVLGANTDEFEKIQEIVQKLKVQEISPEEAKKQAQEIYESKMQYR